MTVQAQDSVQYYDGPINVGAVIPITDFTFIDNSHVSLKIRGIDEIWEYGIDYTVDGADTLTRTITLNRAVEAGQVLAAYLDVPITQNISPEEGGNFPASTNEFVLDKLTYICQMLYERITRALQVSVDTPFNGTLPDPEGKANRIIALNSTGTGLAYSTYDVAELEYIANRLYASVDNVDITANNIEDVITTAANILSVNTVAEAIQNVVTTAESIANVNIVGNDLALGVDSAINKVNANKENIDTNADNIEDIQNAKVNAQTCIDKALEAATNANRANTNANKATIWAEGTDEQVETLGGKHSAKGWAEVTSQGQIQADWEQEDATKKDYIKNKPNLDTGYFPGVHVGLADNLYDASAPVNVSSFWFRTSAGAENITTGTAALRALRGNMLNSGYTPRSGNYTASSGITVNNFDLDAFEANNPSTGTHVFQYNRPNWTLNGSIITPGSWGLDVTTRSESLSITVVGEIAASCTDTSTFATAVGGDTGSYTFIFVDYDSESSGGGTGHVGPYWTYNGEEVALSDYALSVIGEPVNGDSITGNYIAPLLTGIVTVEYVKAVLGTLTPAAVDYLFATISMNQYDKNGIGRLTHIIDNATIDSTGEIVSGTGKVACVRAVGGIYSGYVAYSENQYITRIAHTPLVWNNGAAILPAIGDTLSLDDTTQDVELSIALFDPVSWVCVAVTDDSDLSIHPRWSSGQDQDHTYDEYSDNHVEIPKVDKNGVDLPTGLYGMPAIGNVFDEIKFENVNTYIKRIERVANTVANMAMVQAYGTLYLYDSNYIFYVLKDTDIVVYELGDVQDEYIANDYGTEALVATTPDNMCTLNISYGTNLKDKLRTNVLTISQQDLTAAQQEQVRTNIGISNSANLFDFKWTDHLLNSPNHLRADTFSWQSGDVYTSAYNHLVADLQGTTAETETIGSYTVTFYRATDGHKICLADQETTIANIYSETGIAWYYILDTTNTQFKLPRTKYGFEGLRTNVGDRIDESLPNIEGDCGGNFVTHMSSSQGAGALRYTKHGNGLGDAGGNMPYGGITFDASRSSSTYQNNAPVQERATQMYLYFYVGDYTQTAIEQTAGLNAELFNDKVDKADLQEVQCVVETYQNGTSWYRVYSDGWCEQGGQLKTTTSANVPTTVTFLKPYRNINYNALATDYSTSTNVFYFGCTAFTTTSMGINTNAGSGRACRWRTEGYIEV